MLDLFLTLMAGFGAFLRVVLYIAAVIWAMLAMSAGHDEDHGNGIIAIGLAILFAILAGQIPWPY